MASVMHEKGLGYAYTYDPNAENFRMESHIPVAVALPRYKYWTPGDITDQGREGACVGHAWTSWRNCTPVSPKVDFNSQYANNVYFRARQLDEWDGENYDGTSVQAGAKVMVEQAALGTYIWAKSFEEVEAWVKLYGPVVIGVNWYEGCYKPDKRGFIHPTGQLVGGHAITITGIGANGKLRLQNSWGEDWGQNGLCWLSKQDFLWLMAQRRGFTACTAAELKPDLQIAA